MGCDIHSIGQVKINNQWETKVVDIADGRRDYNSFAIMARVRGRSPWSIEPRGLPSDIELDDDDHLHTPELPCEKYWLGDHSYSHLTLKELNEIFSIPSSKLYKLFNKRRCSDLTNAKRGVLGIIIKSLKELKKQYKVKNDEVRVVFGFDS